MLCEWILVVFRERGDFCSNGVRDTWEFLGVVGGYTETSEQRLRGRAAAGRDEKDDGHVLCAPLTQRPQSSVHTRSPSDPDEPRTPPSHPVNGLHTKAPAQAKARPGQAGINGFGPAWDF